MFISQRSLAALAAVLALGTAAPARADAITDWSLHSAQIVGEARIGAPPAVRVMALVQTAADEAARAAAKRNPGQAEAIDAAIAGAHRSVFVALLPAQKATIERAFDAAMAQLPADASRAQHVALGEAAARHVLAARAQEMPRAPDSYRPLTAPGVYVPTAAPAAAAWPQRAPWRLLSADQFRPAAPPSLASAQWAAEFNEIKLLGAREGAQRTPAQTAVARFWDFSQPAIYQGIVRSVATQPGRDVLANARLFATAAQAMDDALIAVFDAKYTHHRWRPVTAIRNADHDGHDGTQRDPSWAPLIETPMHPEYPCAHCVLAGAVAEVVKAETRGTPPVLLTTSSPTATDGPRSWRDADEFANEVALARIAGGVHFRSATEAGLELGRHVGRWAVAHPRPTATAH
jgi:hypothetical protein